MKQHFGERVKYNIIVIVSAIICAIISMFISYYLVLFTLGKDSNFFKIAQFILAIVSITTFYAPTKYILMKYIHIEEREKND